MSEGLSREKFDLALAAGEERERVLWSILHAKIGQYVEVKSDAIAASSGNVFVEYRQPSGPSGLRTTQSDWWAFEIGDTWIIVPTQKLRALANQAKKTPRPDGRSRIVNGGDYNRYRGVLVPVEWLTTPFRMTSSSHTGVTRDRDVT